MRPDIKYSDIQLDLIGSKQGGVKSALDYKSYNAAWIRIVSNSSLGVNTLAND